MKTGFNDGNDFTNDTSTLGELSKNTEILEKKELNSSIAFKGGITPPMVAYGFHKLCETPVIKNKIEDCKSSFIDSVKYETSKLGDFCVSVKADVTDFFKGAFEDTKELFNNKNDEVELQSKGSELYEAREFGIDKCTEKAKEIFNPGVINEWPNMSLEERKQIAGAYSSEVAQAFELNEYKGVYFEDLEPGTMGYNNGDGSIHLSNSLLSAFNSPLQIVDTITHELRHQYQSECVEGYHNVSDDVRTEWATAMDNYTTEPAWAYDPWGYIYNPLELDARYAGETVVREMTKDFINEQYYA